MRHEIEKDKTMRECKVKTVSFSGTANPRHMRVVVGQYNFDKIDPEEMAFEIESVAVHPSYQ